MTKTPVFGVFFRLFWPSGPYTFKMAHFGVKMGSKPPKNPLFVPPKNLSGGWFTTSFRSFSDPVSLYIEIYRANIGTPDSPIPPFWTPVLTSFLRSNTYKNCPPNWAHCIAHITRTGQISIRRNAMAFSSLMTGTPQKPQKTRFFPKVWPFSLSKTSCKFFNFDVFPGGAREIDKNPCFWGLFSSFLALGALYLQNGTFWSKNGVKTP